MLGLVSVASIYLEKNLKFVQQQITTDNSSSLGTELLFNQPVLLNVMAISIKTKHYFTSFHTCSSIDN